ncbi:MAG: polysaccharide deacetylase family protein [Patescibacteria group bacterium]|jgi:peptidoglycan/xylan/chitin deacetylase (PgdA/CDA1 family)/GT2 family glycosyltransferase
MDKDETSIKFSVIIPARNEAGYIQNCLDSFKKQKLQPFEIIVIDNASTDGTAEIVKKNNVKYIYESRIGLPQARQTGLENAQGDWLVYTDADFIVPKDYLEKIAFFIKSHQDAVVVYNPFIFYDGGKAINNFIKCFFFCFEIKLIRLIVGGNFAIKKNKLADIGGFNTDIKFYGEDADLTKKMIAVGKVYYFKNLWTTTSARRYQKSGFLRTICLYTINYCIFFILKQPVLVFKNKVILTTGRIFVILAIIIYGICSPRSQLFGKVENKIPVQENQQKVVALTFDDGPNGQYTEEVLKILKDEDIKATFFLVGDNVATYPNIAKDIADQGHEIGNHSYYHSFSLPFEKAKNIKQEISQTNEIIFQTTDKYPALFRPPHGWRTPIVFKSVHQEGLRMIEWNNMTTDYFKYAKAESISKNILKNVHSGSIIVLHDGLNLDHKANREETIKALPIIIKELKDQGYSFVTL